MKKDTLHKILPLGSIVSLVNGTKKVMIVGRVQEDVSNGKHYDYASCLYPEGVLNPKELFLFNQEDIDKIYFIGLQDADEFVYRSIMEKELNERNLLE